MRALRPISFALFMGTVATALAACGNGQPPQTDDTGAPTQAPLTADTIAVVNGESVSNATYELYLKLRQQQHPLPRQPNRSDVTEELINLELLYQQAIKEDLQNVPEMVNQLEFQRKNILAGAIIEKLINGFSVTDHDIAEEYAKRYKIKERKEYKTRNILVKTEAEATAIVRELNQGTDFAKLARENSIGPAAATGGALEWFNPEDVLDEFADAVANLKKGEFTGKPVHTKYGWHVILLEEDRVVPAPTLEQVIDTIRNSLLNQRMEAYLQDLRAKANVRINSL
jgi:peptidyl-prolyl cis-trans isomerase C